MLFRLIILIIYIFLAIFSAFSRGSLREYRNVSMFSRNNENDLISIITKSIRRLIASRKSQKYLTKHHNCYILTNKLSTIIYNPSNKVIYCTNKMNRKETATYDYVNQNNYDYNTLNELYDEAFDTILSVYNGNADFSSITSFLDQYFTAKKTTAVPKKDTRTELQSNKMESVDDFFKNSNTKKISGNEEKLDINTALDSQIAKLPGISIILAKKIIKYRELNNGFKSKDEFYKEMKIKPHFQNQLDDLICIKTENIENKQETKLKQPKNNERIIDL